MVDRYTGRGAFRNINNMSRNSSCNGNSCGGSSCCERSGCNNTDSECRNLRKRLQMIDFSMIDTVLYLDAYPHCAEALNYYHKLKKERMAVAEALAHKCNMPITSFENASEDTWNWTDSPWPWEISEN